MKRTVLFVVRSVGSGLLIAAQLAPLGSTACLNEYSTSLSGKVVMDEGGHCPLSAHAIDRGSLAAKLDSLDALAATNGASYENLSDRGVVLVYLGRYEEAIAQFRKLQSKGFDGYAVCANIGTAFELIGQNDSALYYIREAVRQNPTAHEGSEWIHVKVLERKVAWQKDPTIKGSLLGVDFGDGELPVEPKGIDLREFRRHLRYQLQERMTFVRAPDPVVGELLFELGNVEALLNSVECAVDVYKVAAEYGNASPLFTLRYAKLDGMTNKAAILNAIHPATDQKANWITYAFYGTLAAVPVLLLWGLFRLVRRRRAG